MKFLEETRLSKNLEEHHWEDEIEGEWLSVSVKLKWCLIILYDIHTEKKNHITNYFMYLILWYDTVYVPTFIYFDTLQLKMKK